MQHGLNIRQSRDHFFTRVLTHATILLVGLASTTLKGESAQAYSRAAALAAVGAASGSPGSTAFVLSQIANSQSASNAQDPSVSRAQDPNAAATTAVQAQPAPAVPAMPSMNVPAAPDETANDTANLQAAQDITDQITSMSSDFDSSLAATVNSIDQMTASDSATQVQNVQTQNNGLSPQTTPDTNPQPTPKSMADIINSFEHPSTAPSSTTASSTTNTASTGNSPNVPLVNDMGSSSGNYGGVSATSNGSGMTGGTSGSDLSAMGSGSTDTSSSSGSSTNPSSGSSTNTGLSVTQIGTPSN